MNKVYEKKIDKAIFEAIDRGKILGICVGMQALFHESDEGNLKSWVLLMVKLKSL